MTIYLNAYGRRYAICDGRNCHENVIDLSPRFAEASRVLRTFFGWSYDQGKDYCRVCTRARKAFGRTRKKENQT